MMMTKKRHYLSTSLLMLVSITGFLARSETARTVQQKSESITCSNIVAITGNVSINCSNLTPDQKRFDDYLVCSGEQMAIS
jgi:hypothetical protein